MSELKNIVKQLDENLAKLSSGELSAHPHGAARMALLKNGLELLAKEQGVELKKVTEQRAGELAVTCLSGAFGDKFSATLNNYHFRTGIAPTKGHVLPSHTWGYIGHFDVEAMIRANSE